MAGTWEQEGFAGSEEVHNESNTISASLRVEQGDIACLLVRCNRNSVVFTFYEDFLKPASSQAFRSGHYCVIAETQMSSSDELMPG